VPRATAGCAAAVVLLVAAGCGGGGTGGTTTTTSATTAPATPAAQRAEVKRVWERFFAGTTSAADKVQLLENGSAFAAAIEAQAKSALARQSSARVTRVTLVGPHKATVHYSIDLSGKPALTGQTGTAVKVGAAWKVGQASFCRLLALQGSVPTACAGAG
jgi:hypothetical protein